ncbi:hypothetical protein ACLI1Z_17915, partial [Enterococcus faecalis]
PQFLAILLRKPLLDKNKKKSLVITSNLNTPQSKKYLYEFIVNGQNQRSQYSQNTKILIIFVGLPQSDS